MSASLVLNDFVVLTAKENNAKIEENFCCILNCLQEDILRSTTMQGLVPKKEAEETLPQFSCWKGHMIQLQQLQIAFETLVLEQILKCHILLHHGGIDMVFLALPCTSPKSILHNAKCLFCTYLPLKPRRKNIVDVLICTSMISLQLRSFLRFFFVDILMLVGTWLPACSMGPDALVDTAIYRTWSFIHRKITWRAFS